MYCFENDHTAAGAAVQPPPGGRVRQVPAADAVGDACDAPRRRQPSVARPQSGRRPRAAGRAKLGRAAAHGRGAGRRHAVQGSARSAATRAREGRVPPLRSAACGMTGLGHGGSGEAQATQPARTAAGRPHGLLGDVSPGREHSPHTSHGIDRGRMTRGQQDTDGDGSLEMRY